MNTDTTDMLSAELDWRKLDTQFESTFPEYTDNIIIVLDGETPDQTQDAALILYDLLKQESSVFKSLYYPKGMDYFRNNAFLFLETEELYEISDKLSESQAFLSQLVESPNIAGLLSLVQQAVDNNAIQELESFLPTFSNAIPIQDKTANIVSWQNLLSTKNNNTSTDKEFIIVRPELNYSNLYPAETGIKAIQTAIQKSDIQNKFNINARLTGTAMLEHEELKSVSETNLIAIIISVVFVIIMLIFSLDAKQLVVASIITLISGLILTTAYATLIIGELNLISIAFAVLYVGLGIDFAIHYCFSYRDEITRHPTLLLALQSSNKHISKALIFCAITTSIGFFSFVPTDYTGVAELGIIAGSGMFISLFLTLTLLPSLLLLLGTKKKTHYRSIPTVFFKIGLQKHKLTLLLIALLTIISLFQITHIKFDNNVLNLQDPNTESVQTFKELLNDKTISAWNTVILANNESDALLIKGKMQTLDVVQQVVTFNDFIPKEQEAKLEVIDELNLLLGDLSLPEQQNIDHQKQQKSINEFIAYINNNNLDHRHSLKAFAESLSVWSEKNKQDNAAIEKLQYNWFSTFAGRIKQLQHALQAEETQSSDIPEPIKTRWQKDNAWLVEIFPKENLANNEAQERFVKELSSVDNRVIGPPVVNISAGNAVRDAFKQAFTYAFIAVSLLLIILLRSLRDTFCIMLTLSLAALFTITLLPLINIPLNFANIIGLPLLFGIGVDSGIHICNRFKQLNGSTESLMQSSISQAILISGLTTIFSISNLAFASHAGTASMGLLLSAGILLTLVLMLTVLPALLKLFDKQSS